jgi:magnesium-transporting ATPase (P-type)
MKRPPRRRDEKLLSLNFILRSYLVQGTFVAASCYATYYYMGWVLGTWHLGEGINSMPSSPLGLQFAMASVPYLQTLTAYFFPTVATQIANVLCKRSSLSSLFSFNLLNPAHRHEMLEAISMWRLPQYKTRIRIDYQVREITKFSVFRTFSWLKSLERIERPVIVPFTAWLAHFLERHYIIFNFLSNPLIDLGILFELVLCYLFFYTPLAQIYYFAPVPWHVYLFAFHGTLLLFAFEETKKYYRRKGHRLEFLG